jgi:hypothetical protein
MKENPVRTWATWVVRQSRWVFLDPSGLTELSKTLLDLPDPVWVSAYHFCGEEELTLRYLLVLDALNFCFWPPSFFTLSPGRGGRQGGGEKWSVPGPKGEKLTGYYALSFRLRQLAEDFPDFFSPSFLSRVGPEELWDLLGPIPLPAWRARALHEVGALLARFGLASRFFLEAKKSAQKLVELLTSHLPMFRDAAIYRGQWVPFLKRAQILVADLWGTFGGEGFGEFHDLSWLTAFADYKLPQLLWDRRALRLSASFAQRICARELIPRGSEEEVELRAATVVAVEELVGLLRREGRNLLPFQVDWLLWNLSQKGLSVPHHLTLTWAY